MWKWGSTPLARIERDLEQRELWPVGLDWRALTGAESDRIVHSVGESDHDRKIETGHAVLGRVELVEGGIAPAHVVGEPERRHVEVEARE